jgi:formylglycine-generating enzyme required for sulfatase activity
MPSSQLDFDFVLIPAGEFIIGMGTGRGVDVEPDETPQHKLALPDFYIARFPVTNAQYRAFIAATGHRVPKFWQDSKMPEDQADHPVGGVNFYDCLAFCNWASQVMQLPIRLPLEPEWEKAARGDDGRVYPWGNRWEANRANTFEMKLNSTTPVTRFATEGASPYGVADLVGNVSEWCFSMFSRYPYRADDGRELLQLADGQHLPWVERWGLQVTNEPSRLKGNEQRVLRGGSYRGIKAICRCAYRSWAAAIHLSEDTGFRVAYRK